MTQANLRYTEISFDDDGETHFVDQIRPLRAEDYAPPAPPISLLPLADSTRVLAISFPPSFGYDVLHPAPKHQWATIVSGQLEFGVSNGDVRVFSPGDVLNVIDAGSKGHTTRVVGTEAATMLVTEY